MKQQILLIHGGDTYGTYNEYITSLKSMIIESLESLTKKGWKDTLQEKLGEDYEVITPKMPNKNNAKYLEWKLWFEKIVPLLNERVILVGHSLGGIFLAKYLSENTFPKTIVATFLIAAPYDSSNQEYSLADFILGQNLKLFEKNCDKIFLYHSQDDYVVPFEDLEEYRLKLPGSSSRIFDNRGHFNQEEIKELVDDIKTLKD